MAKINHTQNLTPSAVAAWKCRNLDVSKSLPQSAKKLRKTSVSRTAEHSIRGYLYQFLRYLSEILAAAPGTKITIEGVVEDVDVVTPRLTTAIQCKLHEQADKFTLGKIYKPVLQMLEHFGNRAPGGPEIQYRLFCHFPDKAGTMRLTLDDMTTIERTTSDPLKAIIARIPAATDRAAFLTRFTIEFGPCLDDLEQ